MWLYARRYVVTQNSLLLHGTPCCSTGACLFVCVSLCVTRSVCRRMPFGQRALTLGTGSGTVCESMCELECGDVSSFA